MTENMQQGRHLTYVAERDLGQFGCRPLGSIDVLDLKDQALGHLDGIVLDRRDNRPLHLVVAALRGSGPQPQRWFLLPVGDAWFDETARAIRIDAQRELIPFDPKEFERMSPQEADEFERRVLASCCPEIGFRHDGSPDYARLQRFTCPPWLREPVQSH